MNQNIRPGLLIFWSALLLLLSGSYTSMAQAGLGVAGGNEATEEFHFSYSIGQLFNEALDQSGYYVSQGIQHPTLLVISDTTPTNEMQILIKVFPNPVTDEIHIDLAGGELKECKVQLMNIKGKSMNIETFKSSQFSFSLADYAPGHYLLIIESEDLFIRTFKIIKTK